MEKLIEEAMDDLLVKYSFAPAAEHRSTALINDLDLSNKDNSDQLLLKGGAPEHRSPAQLKEEEVMAYYTAITRNDLRQRDRTAYRSGFTDRHGTHRPGVADVPLHIICYGIRETVISWVGRVNSFAFCLLKIHEFNNEGAAPEMAQYSERTFSIRLEVKNSPRMDPEELSLKLRTAARGTQALPMVGADLVEINASKKEPPAAPVVISPEPAAIAAWSKVLRVVRGKVAPRIFLTWFEPLRAQAVTGGVITVNVVSSTVSNWIDSQYGTVLKEAIREAGLAGIEWVFRNEQQSTGTGG
jgi:hypothetical protein